MCDVSCTTQDQVGRCSSPLVSAVLTSIIINIATFAILLYQELNQNIFNFRSLKVPDYIFRFAEQTLQSREIK